MSRICPICKREYPDEFKICVECKGRVQLIDPANPNPQSDVKTKEVFKAKRNFRHNNIAKKELWQNKAVMIGVPAACVVIIACVLAFAGGLFKEKVNVAKIDSGLAGQGSSIAQQIGNQVSANSMPSGASTIVSGITVSAASNMPGPSASTGTTTPGKTTPGKTNENSGTIQSTAPVVSAAPSTGDISGGGNISLPVYQKYGDLIADMKATDDKLRLTTYDYSTFKVENGVAGTATWCTNPEETGISYALVSNNITIMYSYGFQSKEIAVMCQIAHDFNKDGMSKNEINFFKIFLNSILKSNYTKYSNNLEGLYNISNATYTKTNGPCDFYEYNLKIDNIDFRLYYYYLKSNRSGYIMIKVLHLNT